MKVHKWGDVQARHLTPAEIAASKEWARQEAELLRGHSQGAEKGSGRLAKQRSTRIPRGTGRKG